MSMVVAVRRRFVFASLLAPIFASLLASCSLNVDAERVQCRTKADCAARGAAFTEAVCVDSVCNVDPAWACLTSPLPTSMQEPPYKVTFLLRDVVDQTALKGSAQVKLCRKLDVDCASPLATGTSGDGGSVTFSVDMKGFAGYAQIQAEGVVPTLFFLNPAIDHDVTLPISLATPLSYQGVLFTLGRQPSPGHGAIVIASLNCTGAPAAGVSYSTPNQDDMTTPFYTVAGLPAVGATATDVSDGYGGLLNVPVGAVALTANLAKPQVELAKISLLVREDAITYSTVVPLAN